MNNEWIDQILTVWLSLELEPEAKPWGTEVHFAFLLDDIRIHETIRYFLGILNKTYDKLTTAAESFDSSIYLLTDGKRQKQLRWAPNIQCIVPEEVLSALCQVPTT